MWQLKNNMANWNDITGTQELAKSGVDGLDPRIMSVAVAPASLHNHLVLQTNEGEVLRWELLSHDMPTGKELVAMANEHLKGYDEVMHVVREDIKEPWKIGIASPALLTGFRTLPGNMVEIGVEDRRLPVLQVPESTYRRLKQEYPDNKGLYLKALDEQTRLSKAIFSVSEHVQTRPDAVDIRGAGRFVSIQPTGIHGEKTERALVLKDIYEDLTRKGVSPKDIYLMTKMDFLPHSAMGETNRTEGKGVVDGLKNLGHGLSEAASNLFDRLTSGNSQQTMNR